MSLYEQHRKLDRSVSEPASRYKTELCRPFEESGVCKYADKCQFAHGYAELRNLQRHPKYKTSACRTYHSIGFCPYGPRCHFVHNIEETRIHSQKLSAGEARMLNQKVGAQFGPSGGAQPNLMALNPLLMNNNAAAVLNSSMNLNLLEQLTARTMSLQLAQLAQQNQAAHKVYDDSAAYLDMAPKFNRTLLTRTNSLGINPGQSNVVGATRPKPLTLSPTFSLGSTADSISPSSSLSQSPTNSLASFFSDEAASAGLASSPFTFTQDFGVLGARQSPSPRSEEMAPRTPSPSAESRLPVFNRISSTIGDFENLKI